MDSDSAGAMHGEKRQVHPARTELFELVNS
jgi:hypothetical protein